MLGADLFFCNYFILSEANPADDGSRGSDTRKEVVVDPLTKLALENSVPLFPEQVLENRFVRGMPRGPAAQKLLSEFSSNEDLETYLRESFQKPCILGTDRNTFVVLPSGGESRTRRIATGERQLPNFELECISSSGQIPRPLKFMRDAIAHPSSCQELDPAFQRLPHKQSHGIIVGRLTSSADAHRVASPISQLHHLHIPVLWTHAPFWASQGIKAAANYLRQRSSPLQWHRVFRIAHKAFGSTLGYPGEGPPRKRRGRSVPARVPRDLSQSMHAVTTVQDRAKAVGQLKHYLTSASHPPLDQLVFEVRLLNEACAEFVQHCYDNNESQGTVINALLSLQDTYWGLSHSIVLPWVRISAWQRGEPPELRHARPGMVFRAMISVALLWNWQAWADAALCMFHGLGRPGEVLHATWGDTHFPRMLEPWDVNQRDMGLIRIREPKTRWRGARLQLLLLEDAVILERLKLRKAAMSEEHKIWPFSPLLWSKRMQLILKFLGIPENSSTPACLRAGGATYEYLVHYSVPRLRLKGRGGGLLNGLLITTYRKRRRC